MEINQRKSLIYSSIYHFKGKGELMVLDIIKLEKIYRLLFCICVGLCMMVDDFLKLKEWQKSEEGWNILEGNWEFVSELHLPDVLYIYYWNTGLIMFNNSKVTRQRYFYVALWFLWEKTSAGTALFSKFITWERFCLYACMRFRRANKSIIIKIQEEKN